MLPLDYEQTRHALGISGHLCQVLTHVRYSFSEDRPLTKYGMPGWQNTGGIMAALFAEMGYSGDLKVFDGKYGFFQFCGYDGEVDLHQITRELGSQWLFTRIALKPYPCCRMLHGGIDCLKKIIDDHKIRPEEIERIEVLGHPTIELPCFLHEEVENVLDAQFNAAYVYAVVANGVRIGPDWQDSATMHDPKIRNLMKKIQFSGHPDFIRRAQEDSSAHFCTVDLFARGQRYHAETLQPRGIFGTPGALSDSEIENKFRQNAMRILTPGKIDRAVDALLNLEKYDTGIFADLLCL